MYAFWGTPASKGFDGCFHPETWGHEPPVVLAALRNPSYLCRHYGKKQENSGSRKGAQEELAGDACLTGGHTGVSQ